jgi:hypothetical protein
MHDKKKMDALVAKIANGSAGPKARSVSTAPPRPAKAKASKKAAAQNPATPNENTVIGSETKIPAPMVKKQRGGGMSVTINFGKEYC